MVRMQYNPDGTPRGIVAPSFRYVKTECVFFSENSPNQTQALG